MKPIVCLLALAVGAAARDLHVAETGNDTNPGSAAAPLRSISAAALLATPGDVVTVHAGIYREHVNPPRGGPSDRERIVYQAAPGERVVITGSEPVAGWTRVTGDTWTVTLPNARFGSFNPYADEIRGDWFAPNGRAHHTGCVYVDGEWLVEAAKLDEVLKPAGTAALWFATVDASNTTIWAQFAGGRDPDRGGVEINVRQHVFSPTNPGVDFLTVRGFVLRNAAVNWAPPSAAQFGIVSAYWCKGWIIESNEIAWSKCCGVALGKYGDEFDNSNKAGAADPYTACVRRALSNGWNRATVGGHVVRNNHIHHCDQTGIVGSMGCAFSTVSGNEIHDIHTHRRFGGAEMAGIKFHGAIDTVIRDNHVYRCGDISGIWLDWMCQGAQVTGNLLHDNEGSHGDIFLEMQHGPLLVANNLLLSPKLSFSLNAQGVAIVHNLIAGPIRNHTRDDRVTPFQAPHDTAFAGLYPAREGDSGDHRLLNNVVIGRGDFAALDSSALPCTAGGNVFTGKSRPSRFDTNALVRTDFDPGARLEQRPDGWYLTLDVDPSWRTSAVRRVVTTEVLGKAKVSSCAYEQPDGSPFRLDTDYLGKTRDAAHPSPGPFEPVPNVTVKVWPKF